ncbi:aminomethyl transferase family protein [Nonomuraea sp. K274]|uniref:Aminomethyl transferase family protein n=1 Tax=Nonomuraea cypriaca TaxID=1187855 RepID=A0A931A5V2_9ACTN|nr:aminomethyl transferase family protein [Nonomuraea cypriaca]MBF8186911.1 aminomethyl transferase family protein [Nonomuraea cypriaca]
MTVVTKNGTPLSTAYPVTPEFRTVGGTELAWRFSTREAEYKALREDAGLIDWGDARVIEVRGETVDFMQRLLTRDVEYLAGERCVCSLVLDEAGKVVDIVTVYGRDEGMLLESSPAGGDRLWAHLTAHADESVEIVDRSGDLTVVGLEGPNAWRIIGRLFGEETTAMPFESMADTSLNGTDVLLARTGVTGEYGYKLITGHAAAVEFWHIAAERATPIGMETVEAAMLEVRQPIMHREVSDEHGVVVLGLSWLVETAKETFVGREAMLAEFETPATIRTIGFAGESGGTVPASGTPVLADGHVVGSVVHAVDSSGLGAVLGLMRVDATLAAAGLPFTVGELDVETMSTPYILPKSWITPIS